MKVLDFKDDLKSSIVVFLVALPLCLGIALASNAPIAAGLISGIIGGIVIGLFSGSGISVSGPAAGLTVIVVNGIATLGGFETFGLAVLMAGLIQIIFGLVKGGAIGDYFPTAVIKGMLAAIGLILILKQFPNAFSRENMGINIISVCAMVIMLGWEKLNIKLVPAALVAVVATVIINQFFHLVAPEHLVQLPDAIFSHLKFPQFQNVNSAVIGVAITIAIVASLETLLCIDAADKIDPLKRKTNKNRELFAQGIGNLVAGFIGGLPLTAVIVRTSTNVTAGGKTKVSAILHGVWILSLVLLIPNYLRLIPLATLACVLLMVGYKLTKPTFYAEMYRRGWEQLVIFCVTIGGILATDLLKGIFVGLGVAILFELRKPAMTCLEISEEGHKVHVKFTKNVSFLHKAKIHKILNDIPAGKHVHIHGLKVVRVHVDVHELILEYHAEAKKRGMEISFA
jgi:MFS superfamily sulfate permease-like transporter